jgi:hypothetical protein
MGIALRDQSGNLRRSEDLLGDVADAFARIEDPAERVRLAFKLFDSEGVALVNLLRGGSGALDEMRERARDLGIVLDEHLVRDAERTRTELDTLAQVISAKYWPNAGAVLILYCDGTNVIQLAGLVATIDDIGDVVITTAASGQMLRFNGASWINEDSPYDVGMFIPGTHGNGALLAQVVLTRAVSFADDFAGARARRHLGGP